MAKRSGNSFNSVDREKYIEYEWTNFKMAKESLLRIMNHYEFYKENSDLYRLSQGKKLPKGVKWDNKHRRIQLVLVTDEGKLYPYAEFWTGYFEKLYKAEIIISSNDTVYIPRMWI